MPRVSIGLTVFNSERYLEECLPVAPGSDLPGFRTDISDNASCDRTQRIALGVRAQDDRVRYVRNRMNIGSLGTSTRHSDYRRGSSSSGQRMMTCVAQDFLLRCVGGPDRDLVVVLAYPRTVGIDEQGRVTVPHRLGPDLTSPDPAIRFARIMRAPFWATSLFGLVIRSGCLSRLD